MSKKNIQIVDVAGQALSSVPPVKRVKPFNNQILIELLTKQELANTKILVGDGGNYGAPQAYVLEVGPGVNKDLGLKAGDRILLQGSYVPVPNYDDSHREKGLTLPDMIKGLIVEGK